MPKYREEDWTLLINAPVEIRKNGRLVRSGTVDQAMPDSSIIWLAAEGQYTRRLFEAKEGFEVWAENGKDNSAAHPVRPGAAAIV